MIVTSLPNSDGRAQGPVEESFQEMISIEPVVQSLSRKTSLDLGDEQSRLFQAIFFFVWDVKEKLSVKLLFCRHLKN